MKFTLLFTLLLHASFGFSQTETGQRLYGDFEMDQFGTSVSLNGTGTIQAIGSRQLNSSSENRYIKVYELEGTNWEQLGATVVVASTQNLDLEQLKLNSAGTIFLTLGFEDTHSVAKVYGYIQDDWVQLGEAILGDPYVPESILTASINSAGDRIVIGYTHDDDDAGIAYGSAIVYEYASGHWNQLGNILYGTVPGDFMGASVSLNAAGTILAVGSSRSTYNEGENRGDVKVYKYNENNNIWQQMGSPIVGIDTGNAYITAIDAEGKRVAVSNNQAMNAAGQIKVYDFENNAWSQIGNTLNGAFGDRLGFSLELSDSGTRIAAGELGNSSGKVTVFDLIEGAWEVAGAPIQRAQFGDGTGTAIGLSDDGNSISIGSRFYDQNFNRDGLVRTFSLPELELSVLENTRKNTLILVPNPASDTVTITSETDTFIKDVSLYNLLGQRVLSEENSEKTTVYRLDISRLPSANYLGVITTETETFYKKISKR